MKMTVYLVCPKCRSNYPYILKNKQGGRHYQCCECNFKWGESDTYTKLQHKLGNKSYGKQKNKQKKRKIVSDIKGGTPSHLTKEEKQTIKNFFYDENNWSANAQQELAFKMKITKGRIARFRRNFIIVERKCKNCGKIFHTSCFYDFCSKECKQDSVEKELTKTCKTCRKIFRAKRRYQIYCSYECRAKDYSMKDKMGTCPICKGRFIKRRKNHIFCSIECSNKSRTKPKKRKESDYRIVYIPKNRPSCPRCNSKYILSDGPRWKCGNCSREWSKNLAIVDGKTVVGWVKQQYKNDSFINKELVIE